MICRSCEDAGHYWMAWGDMGYNFDDPADASAVRQLEKYVGEPYASGDMREIYRTSTPCACHCHKKRKGIKVPAVLETDAQMKARSARYKGRKTNPSRKVHRKVHRGPRGGRYFIRRGRKVYV